MPRIQEALGTRHIFLNWLKKQEFYNDTTIIITGDHLNPNVIFEFQNNSKLTVYNCIINSKIITDNVKNRKFSLIDLYPTTLAAMGFELNSNRLGFGTNLFSGDVTLTEKYDLDYIRQELQKMPTDPIIY